MQVNQAGLMSQQGMALPSSVAANASQVDKTNSTDYVCN